jgi:succinoglycan biosynthesis protein ExoA
VSSQTLAEQFPLVSVVMPVRNEAHFIVRSLGCVLAQDYPADRLEIIVADGESTDETAAIIRQLQTAHAQLRLIQNPGRIAPTGLNARGSIVVRVDGHCEIAPDYVRRCVEHLQRGGVDGVGGPLETIGENRLAQAIAAAMSSTFGVGNSAFRTLKERTLLTDTIAFPAYTRAIIERAGPYDEELVRNQDDEYNYRLRKLGARLLLAADVRSRYFSRSSLRSLWRQYFQYGYWKVRVWQKHPRQMSLRQFIPPVFVLTLGLGLLLSPWLALPLVLLSACYLIANLLASCLTARRTRWLYLPLLPIIFATLHLSYGAGFLSGLMLFARRWGTPQADSPAHARGD